MSTEELDRITRQVELISREVGAFLLRERRTFSTDQVEKKGFNDLVSHVDKSAEQQFVNALSELLPEAGFIAEEGTGKAQPNGLNWVIDPLDGTTNYVHNIPFYCTSVALVEGNSPLLGVIFDPAHGELFSAVAGMPALLNGQPISVSEEKQFQSMLMVTGFPYEDDGQLQANLNVIGALTKESRGIRRLGSAALDMCYVACGRMDGFYEYGLKAWDVAAGTCIVRQAGGKVDDFKGNNDPLFNREIIAASKQAFEPLGALIKRYFVS